jgi:hypothetical protein
MNVYRSRDILVVLFQVRKLICIDACVYYDCYAPVKVT